MYQYYKIGILCQYNHVLCYVKLQVMLMLHKKSHGCANIRYLLR